MKILNGKRITRRQIWSILLCLCMVLSSVPVASMAVGAEQLAGEEHPYGSGEVGNTRASSDTTPAGQPSQDVNCVEDDCDGTYQNGFCTVCDGYQPCKGSGTETDPYQIANAGNLYRFAAQVNAGDTGICGKLIDNITVNGSGSGTSRSWTPIGKQEENGGFVGIFDGDHFTISGLSTSGGEYAGLFGCVGSEYNVKKNDDGSIIGGTVYKIGRVKNVTVADSYFCASTYVGGIACVFLCGGITGCTNSSVIEGEIFVGGIAGESVGLIQDCINIGTVIVTSSSSAYLAGGVVGVNMGTVRNCINCGDVCVYTGSASSSCYADSVCGACFMGGSIDNCYYLGTSETDKMEGTTYMTDADFKSGKVTYLLNGEKSSDDVVWKQTINGTNYPSFRGGIVYSGYTICDETAEMVYSNDSSAVSATRPAHNYVNGFCSKCGKPCPYTGCTDDVTLEWDDAHEHLYCYDVNHRLTYAGLILYTDGFYYYVRTSGEAVVGQSYWITKTNGLMGERSYTFDEDGKMVDALA